MANPPNAETITRPMDPADIEHFTITITSASDGTGLLNDGEDVADYTLALTAEAIAAGLIIKEGDGYETELNGRSIGFWLEVDAEKQADAAFTGAGLALGLEVTVTTTATPPRVKQKTVVVQVAQQ